MLKSAVEWKRVWLFFLIVRRTHVTFYGTVNFRKRFIMTVLPIVGWGMWRSLLSMSKGRRTGYNVAHTLTYQMCTYLTGSSEKWIYLAACVMANPPFDTIFYQKWHPTKINAIQNSLNSLVDAVSKHSILFSWNFNWAIMEQRRYSLSGEKELATASVVPLLSEAIPRTHLNITFTDFWLSQLALLHKLCQLSANQSLRLTLSSWQDFSSCDMGQCDQHISSLNQV